MVAFVTISQDEDEEEEVETRHGEGDAKIIAIAKIAGQKKVENFEDAIKDLKQHMLWKFFKLR